MSSVPKTHLTPEQYLAIERAAETRSEYYRGEMFAMVGASRKHNLISLNAASEIRQQLKDRKCEVYQSDMRVRISATGLYTYPDVVVTCERPGFEGSHADTLLNPQVIIEVLSPSTELWDRGKKFEHYRTIHSLREYVLISQERMIIEKFTRHSDGPWMLSDVRNSDDMLALDSIGCRIKVSEIYARVVFEEVDECK